MDGKTNEEDSKKITYKCDKCNTTVTHPVSIQVDKVVV